jgi:hypothetical protein
VSWRALLHRGLGGALDEAKAARGLLELVQAHDNAPHLRSRSGRNWSRNKADPGSRERLGKRTDKVGRQAAAAGPHLAAAAKELVDLRLGSVVRQVTDVEACGLLDSSMVLLAAVTSMRVRGHASARRPHRRFAAAPEPTQPEPAQVYIRHRSAGSDTFASFLTDCATRRTMGCRQPSCCGGYQCVGKPRPSSQTACQSTGSAHSAHKGPPCWTMALQNRQWPAGSPQGCLPRASQAHSSPLCADVYIRFLSGGLSDQTSIKRESGVASGTGQRARCHRNLRLASPPFITSR